MNNNLMVEQPNEEENLLTETKGEKVQSSENNDIIVVEEYEEAPVEQVE